MTWHFYSAHKHTHMHRERQTLVMYRIEEALYKIWYIAFLFLVSHSTYIKALTTRITKKKTLSLSNWVRYLGWTLAWLCPHADGLGFDLHIRQHTFVEIGHHSETISTVMYFFLLWRLVMKRFLRPCTGKRMCTKAWWLHRNGVVIKLTAPEMTSKVSKGSKTSMQQ